MINESEKIRQSPVILIFKLMLLTVIVNLVDLALILISNSMISGGLNETLILTLVAVLFIVMFIMETVLVINLFLNWLNYYYIIDADGIARSCGIIAKNHDYNVILGIDNITYRQSFWGRIFNYGDVILTEPTSDTKPIFLGVSNPQEYAAIIQQKFHVQNGTIRESSKFSSAIDRNQ